MKNDKKNDPEIKWERLEKSIELPERIVREDPQLARDLSKHQLTYSILGLVLGLAAIIGGIVLLLNGVAGSTSWTTKILGAESALTDASAGVVLFVVGLFTVFVTRYKIKVRK